MLIGMVLQCSDMLNRFESGQVRADQTTTVVHSYKLLIKDVKPVHSLTRNFCGVCCV